MTAPGFLPLDPPRLVAAGPEIRLHGPGTRFSVGQLVEAPQEDNDSRKVLALAGRRR
jgi:hypothetical protein